VLARLGHLDPLGRTSSSTVELTAVGLVFGIIRLSTASRRYLSLWPESNGHSIDVKITTDELWSSGIPEGHYVALVLGQDLKLTTRLDLHKSHRQVILSVAVTRVGWNTRRGILKKRWLLSLGPVAICLTAC
jgi:hypothetical protein